jgi:predicted ABC-type ATPase
LLGKLLSPFQPEKEAFESGRIMLNGINELLANNEVFAFETALATKALLFYKTALAFCGKNEGNSNSAIKLRLAKYI